MATQKICDECGKACDEFVSEDKMDYEWPGDRQSAVKVEFDHSRDYCPPCRMAIIKKALKDALEPLIKRRTKPDKEAEAE